MMEVDDLSSPGLEEVMDFEDGGPRKEGKYLDPVALIEIFNKEKNQIGWFTVISRLVKLVKVF